MTLTSLLPPSRLKRQITFRNLKQILSVDLAADLQHITCPASETVDELVEHYNTSLSSVLMTLMLLLRHVNSRLNALLPGTHWNYGKLKQLAVHWNVNSDTLGSLSTNWPSVNIKESIARP